MDDALKKWKEKYFNQKVVDVNKEFNDNEKITLQKLGIKLLNKIYTEYEFELLDGDVILYYYNEEMTEDEKAECKKLPDNVSREEYNNLLDKITVINSKHNF